MALFLNSRGSDLDINQYIFKILYNFVMENIETLAALRSKGGWVCDTFEVTTCFPFSFDFVVGFVTSVAVLRKEMYKHV